MAAQLATCCMHSGVFSTLLSSLCALDLTRLGLTAFPFKGACLKIAVSLNNLLSEALRINDVHEVLSALEDGAHPNGWPFFWGGGSAFIKVVEEIILCAFHTMDDVDTSDADQVDLFALLALFADNGLSSFVGPPPSGVPYSAASVPDWYLLTTTSAHFRFRHCLSIFSILANRLREFSEFASLATTRLSVCQRSDILHTVHIMFQQLLGLLVGFALKRGGSFRHNVLLHCLHDEYFDDVMRIHGLPDEVVHVAYLGQLKSVMKCGRDLLFHVV